MPVKLESFDGGLFTAPDPILTPDGTLVRAGNARYRPGDPAIWQAEGRAKVGTGGHGDPYGDVVFARGIVWDPGTTVDGTTEERFQLLYANAPAPGEVYTVSAEATPGDPAMDTGNKRTWTFTHALGIQVPDVVAYQNEFFLFSGGQPNASSGAIFKNHWIKRGATGQSVGVHGLPAQETAASTYDAGASGTGASEDRIIEHWWTWYDSTNEIESEATIDAVGWYLITAGGTSQYKLVIATSALLAARPSNADKVRVYIGLGAYTGVSPAAGQVVAYPIGYMLTETDIDTMPTVSSGGTTYSVLTGTTEIEPYIDPSIYYPPYRTAIVAGVPISRYGAPPLATTGDVYEESLVLNDVNDPRKVRFSYPGEPHAFPGLFFINFETKEADEVVAIRTLGNRLGVYLRNSVWRVNWLPRESDFDFNRGRVKDIVADGKGAVNKEAVATFTHPLLGPVQAFIDRTGIYMTDLVEPPVKITSHLDWRAIKGYGDINRARLVDDPDEERLIFQIGSNLFYFHYDPAHLAEGRLSVTGPCGRPGGIGNLALVTTSNGTRVVVTTDTGASRSMFYEARGFTDASTGAALTWDVETKEVYPYGIGNEGKTHDFIIHMKPSGFGSGSWYGILKARTVQGERLSLTDQVELTARTLKTTTANKLIESYSIALAGSSTQAAMAVNVAGVRTESLEEADSR